MLSKGKFLVQQKKLELVLLLDLRVLAAVKHKAILYRHQILQNICKLSHCQTQLYSYSYLLTVLQLTALDFFDTFSVPIHIIPS